MRYVLGFVLLAIALAPATMAQSREQAKPADMAPGLWEMTVQMEAPLVGPVMTSQQCIASEDEGKVKKPKAKKKDDCDGTDVPAASNEVAYSVHCTKLKRTGNVKFTYYGDHYEGTAVTIMDGMEVRTKYTGRRIGACDTQSSAATAGEN